MKTPCQNKSGTAAQGNRDNSIYLKKGKAIHCTVARRRNWCCRGECDRRRTRLSGRSISRKPNQKSRKAQVVIQVPCGGRKKKNYADDPSECKTPLWQRKITFCVQRGWVQKPAGDHPCYEIHPYYTRKFIKIQAIFLNMPIFVNYDDSYVNIVMLTSATRLKILLPFSIV